VDQSGRRAKGQLRRLWGGKGELARQLQIRPSLQFSAKAAIQTASMMFSILRRKVASPVLLQSPSSDSLLNGTRLVCHVQSALRRIPLTGTLLVVSAMTAPSSGGGNLHQLAPLQVDLHRKPVKDRSVNLSKGHLPNCRAPDS
jgi:hypothetical protein